MDEVLRAKRLTAEILARAASIQLHMASVNQSMANMQRMEEEQIRSPTSPAPKVVKDRQLLDLPDDCLTMLAQRQDCSSACALAQTCWRLQHVVNSDELGWEMRCRRDWGVTSSDPHSVIRLDTCLLAELPGMGSPSKNSAPGNLGSSPGSSTGRSNAGRNTGSLVGGVGGGGGGTSQPGWSSAHAAMGHFGRHPQLTGVSIPGCSAPPLQLSSERGGRAATCATPASGPFSASGSSDRLDPGSAPSLTSAPAAAGSNMAQCLQVVLPPVQLSGRLEPGGEAGWEAPDANMLGATAFVAAELSNQAAVGLRALPPHPTPPTMNQVDVMRGSVASWPPTTSLALPHLHTSTASQAPLLQQHPPGSSSSNGRSSSISAGNTVGTHPMDPGRRSSLPESGLVQQDGQPSIAKDTLTESSWGEAAEQLLPNCPGHRGPLANNEWRRICKDRALGWQLAVQLLQWLKDHHNPRSVSGSLHRAELQLALRYMGLCTDNTCDKGRRQVVVQGDGLRSLLALLANESATVVELALQVLANLAQGDADTKVLLVVGSRMGKLLSDKLDSSHAPGIVHQAARALINLWATEPVPEVCLTDMAPLTRSVACPTSSVWQLQEYSLRGESMNRLHVTLRFERMAENASPEADRFSMQGEGFDMVSGAPEEFKVVGHLQLDGGSWQFERLCQQAQQTWLYQGKSDSWGAYGVYTSKRVDVSAATFVVSTGRQPRVFRLFRSART